MQAGEKKPESQIERVALALREMLLRGDFSPGERLAELNLVPRLNASRTPVRLALERLAHEGLLEPLPGRAGSASASLRSPTCGTPLRSGAFWKAPRRGSRPSGSQDPPN